MSKRFIFFLIIALNSSNVFSQISTDRPDQTESAVVLSKGQIQIESGILFELLFKILNFAPTSKSLKDDFFINDI